jgi:uncharacterized membrane protein
MVAAALSALITTAALLAVPPCRRCLTPVSRVALALLLTIALAEIPAAVDAALTVVVVLTTGAINRARERADKRCYLDKRIAYLDSLEGSAAD